MSSESPQQAGPGTDEALKQRSMAVVREIVEVLRRHDMPASVTIAPEGPARYAAILVPTRVRSREEAASRPPYTMVFIEPE